MSDGEAVRVLVVDDQELVRDGIASVLSVQPGIDVLGTAADGAEAVELALRLGPDVVLMDVRMPVLDGVTATAELHRRAPRIRVIVLTTFDDEEYVVDAVRHGASGFLLKDLPAAELARAVRLAAAGIDQYDPAATRRIAEAFRRQASSLAPPSTAAPPAEGTAPATALSPREREVLRLLATGATNREIARQLYLSEGTVKNYVSTILGVLALRDRTQAALFARDQGWV